MDLVKQIIEAQKQKLSTQPEKRTTLREKVRPQPFESKSRRPNFANNPNAPCLNPNSDYEGFVSASSLMKRPKTEKISPQTVSRSFVCPAKNQQANKGPDHFEEQIESEILTRNPGVNWSDIAGLSFAKRSVHESVVWPLLRPDIFKGIRAPPKGLLLFGPPGTGKTMIGKAIASEAKATFFSISASSITSKWVGEGEKLVKALFSVAVRMQPSVIFIDEIDSLLNSRSDNEQEGSRRVKTEFLVQIDGAGTNAEDKVLIIGATNRPQELDEAIIRRLARRMYIPLPNTEGRRQLVRRLLQDVENQISETDIDWIVSETKGYSGSDMKMLCTEASLNPLRSVDITTIANDEIPPVTRTDFESAIQIIKPSVDSEDLTSLVDWNKRFGSFHFEEHDN